MKTNLRLILRHLRPGMRQVARMHNGPTDASRRYRKLAVRPTSAALQTRLRLRSSGPA